MKIFLSAGHSQLKNGTYTSAQGHLNEYKENVYQVNKIASILRQQGHTVDTCIIPEKSLTSASQEQNYKLPKERAKSYDYCIEIHFNAFNGSASGSEVLYYNKAVVPIAEKIVKNLSQLFNSRGLKHRDNLYMLTKTKSKAMIIEVCFVDSKKDSDTYSKNKDKVALLIAEGIHGKSITQPSKPSPDTNTGETYFRVVCGSYKDRNNAEDMQRKLKEAGFDSFLDAYKK